MLEKSCVIEDLVVPLYAYTDTRRQTYKSAAFRPRALGQPSDEEPLCLTCREPTRGSSAAIRCGRFIGAIPRGISPRVDSDDGR